MRFSQDDGWAIASHIASRIQAGRLMTACAEICRTAAHFMLMNSEHAKHLCKECAEIFDQCEADCVEACRRCAEECRKMAQPRSAQGQSQKTKIQNEGEPVTVI